LKKWIIYSFRILGGLILFIIIVVLLAAVLIQTKPVKNKLARIAGVQASKFIEGEVTVGKIDGNFFTHIILEDILLTQDNDTIAYIQGFHAGYDLLALLKGTIDVHSALIERPYIFLEQLNDSVWNVQQLVTPSEEPDTVSTDSMPINISRFRITGGHIIISSPDTVIPRQINNLNTQLSLKWSDSEKLIVMNNFSFQTRQPELQLNRLEFRFREHDQVFELNDFYLETAQNQLEGSAMFQMDPDRKGSASFKTGELHPGEFEYYIPVFGMEARPVISIEAILLNDSVYLEAEVAHQNQVFTVDLSSPNLYTFLTTEQARLVYRADGHLKNINPALWSGNKELDYIINGIFSATGEGVDPADADVRFITGLNESTIEERRFSKLDINVRYNRGNLDGILTGNGDFGIFRVQPQIRNLLEHPVYDIDIWVNQLDIGALMGNDTLSSNINLQASIKGREFDPEIMSAEAEIILSPSQFQNFTMDTLLARVRYSNENLQIDSMWLQTHTVTAEAKGNYSLNANSDLYVILTFDGISEFAEFIPVTDLSTSGNLKAHLTGKPDSLQIEARLILDSTRYTNISIEELQLDARGMLTLTDTLFSMDLYTRNLIFGEFAFDSATVHLEGSMDSVFTQTQLINEDIYTNLHAGIVPGERTRITIPHWLVRYKTEEWQMMQPPAILEFDTLSYSIDNFRLASGTSDTAQFLAMQGYISRKGKEDFTIEAGNLNIRDLSSLFDVDINADGLANVFLQLSGTSELLEIQGNFDLEEAAFNGYRFRDFSGTMEFSNNLLNVAAQILPADSGRFEIMAAMPLEINLDTMGYRFSENDSMNASIVIEDFSLAVLNSFDVPAQTTGFIEGNIRVNGTPASPNPEGNIRLRNASVVMREYGINYRDIRLNVNVHRDRFEVDTFLIRTSDGYLTGTGHMNFGSDFIEGDISDSKIGLSFNNFNPVDHRQFNMQVDGNASIGAEKGQVVFEGDIKIPQADFYLPAIFRLMGRMESVEMPKPILVQEMERMTAIDEPVQYVEVVEVKSDTIDASYFENLKGRLRIRIPRNTWVRNDDMRIEISGELDLLKNEEFFELFGIVEVVRGQYELMGRVFVIDEGTINFEGGEDMNLKLNITASYTFRNNEQIQQELTVTVSGTPEEPEISFELDGNAIDEGDALSYIIFGRSMEELTMSEQQNMQGAGVGSLAGQAAATLISAQLTNFLQNKLDVDYIEIKSGGGFDEATVVVGKYITNNLFVSYEQRFGETNEHNPKKYEVKLEYELFRFLFFELNNSTIDSGFDVIFKIDVM
jgi:translocation and assembly module TamB